MWGGPGGLRTCRGAPSARAPRSANFAVWWDGDLLRELLDRNTIWKWDWQNARLETLFTAEGCLSNNGTKATPALSADLFGDWREEVVFRTADNQALRIYTTTIPTEHRMCTLMHDPQYRLSIAWQNVAYNQPPHTGFYLGEAMEPPPRPAITIPAVGPPGRSYQSHFGTRLHFGQRNHDRADRIEVRWLGAGRQTLENVAAGQRLAVIEGRQGRVQEPGARIGAVKRHRRPDFGVRRLVAAFCESRQRNHGMGSARIGANWADPAKNVARGFWACCQSGDKSPHFKMRILAKGRLHRPALRGDNTDDMSAFCSPGTGPERTPAGHFKASTRPVVLSEAFP